jgi:LAO/AO transport system kinase
MANDMNKNINALKTGVLEGDRRLLAQAITLVESSREDHQKLADQLINSVLPATGNSIRLGITGTPGVGKSTFIETTGTALIEKGHSVAVLTIDPSSSKSGGSILGDKTRMQKLSTNPKSFIRATPSRGMLGGVSPNTREAILLCEASGFDVVIIETVGVGQSEITVRDMVDMFVLLVQPAGGDDLQGIKRGVVEMADLLIVTKADGPLLGAALQAQSDYKNALALSRPLYPNWVAPVVTCSALSHTNIDQICQLIKKYHKTILADDTITQRRSEQAVSWLWSDIMATVSQNIRSHPDLADIFRDLEERVAARKMTARAGSRLILDAFIKKTSIGA